MLLPPCTFEIKKEKKKKNSTTSVLCLVRNAGWRCGATHWPTAARPSSNTSLFVSLVIFPALNYEATNVAQLFCFEGIAQFLSHTHTHMFTQHPTNKDLWIIQGKPTCNCSFTSVGKFPAPPHQTCFFSRRRRELRGVRRETLRWSRSPVHVSLVLLFRETRGSYYLRENCYCCIRFIQTTVGCRVVAGVTDVAALNSGLRDRGDEGQCILYIIDLRGSVDICGTNSSHVTTSWMTE